MALLEQRISMTEDRLTNVVAYSRGMVEVPSTLPQMARGVPYSSTQPPAARTDATEYDPEQEPSFEVQQVYATQSSSFEEDDIGGEAKPFAE